MALPTPPKYKRFTEKNDLKHAEKQRAKRVAKKAELERLMREMEREKLQERLRKQGPFATLTNDPLNNVVFYINN